MKLATLADGTRDGELVIVDRQGSRYVSAGNIAPNLQRALDEWESCRAGLARLALELEQGRLPARELAGAEVLAPLPRAYEWVDGSAFVNHVLLVRRARGVDPPPGLYTDPLVYQGGSGVLLGPHAPFPLPDVTWGLDFEAEVAIVLGDVERGLDATRAEDVIRLILLANDWSYRNLIPGELAKGFGFFNSKPATSFAPFALTPDELGPAWRGGRLHGPLSCTLNGERVGHPDAGVGMHFSFYELIAHIAKTRDFTAGTLLGSGTVSNPEEARGVACLAEKRTLETLHSGAPSTRYLEPGDVVRIEMLDETGRSLFGAIEERVVAA